MRYHIWFLDGSELAVDEFVTDGSHIGASRTNGEMFWVPWSSIKYVEKEISPFLTQPKIPIIVKKEEAK